ncbi:MAG: HAD family hydrolase [Thiohalocapsa sp.]|uniref:HAD family hydrolase n=1 Tax=Thiohalocapsa sp. TaxID=2497641 RepID=UPI0025E4CCB6|nr:HAD family hydrolase [Thiohalocapsa sp.]MCG6940126.1 HAD family hydrolase [Thiohalocapsa sp.]
MTTAADDARLIERIRALTSPLTPQPTGAAPSLDPMAGIRAVLFDVYGTLVISGSGDIGLTADTATGEPFADAWMAAELPATKLPADFDGRAALTAQIRADHARSRARGVAQPEVDILTIWQALLADLGLQPDVTQLRRFALEYELRVNPVWPMPALRAVIAGLADRGLVLGIVSNAQFYTPLMLHAFLGQPIDAAGFDPRCCAWSYRQGVAKPATAVYEPALACLREHHGIRPGQVLYIGNDMRNDVRPAQALGCRTVLFAGDARSLRLRENDPDMQGIAPDRVVTLLGQLTSHLLPPA